MDKEPQDFSKVESKFRLSLLNMEKRFVDLETVISELASKVGEGETSPIAEVNQRVDDIEDLIMVEQAGIIELKKMLGEMPRTEAPAMDLSGVEKRLVDLEQKLSVPAPAAQNVDIQPITNEVNALKQEIGEKLKQVQGVAPGIDVQFIASKYDALKASIDDLMNKKVSLELKIEGLQKSIAIMESRAGEQSPERFAEEINNNKKDMILVLSRVDSVDKVIMNMNADLQQIQANMSKMESFEKLTMLGREIESKIERFKLVEDELRRLSARMEALYSNMDKRIDAASKAEKKIPELLDAMNNIRKELDKQKLEILDRMKKDEVPDFSQVVESKYNELTQKISKLDVADKKSLETVKVEMKSTAEGLRKEVVGVAADFQNSYNLLNALQKEIKNKLDAQQMKDLVKKGDLQPIYKFMKDIDGKYTAVDRKVNQLRVDEILKLIEVVKKDIDEKLGASREKEDSLVDEVVKRTEFGLDDMDYRVQTLLDKIVYLESRMAAVEKMMENMRMQPLILE